MGPGGALSWVGAWFHTRAVDIVGCHEPRTNQDFASRNGDQSLLQHIVVPYLRGGLEHGFYFYIQLGIWSPQLTRIFQRGWNRQPDIVGVEYPCVNDGGLFPGYLAARRLLLSHVGFVAPRDSWFDVGDSLIPKRCVSAILGTHYVRYVYIYI